jgi:EmrB/QacA subfamily drug resistance transporter
LIQRIGGDTVYRMTPPATKEKLDPALLKLAGIVLLGAIAAQLDATIVSVAIDTLGRDLHASVATIQWVSTAYLLTLALMLPISGWAAQRYGTKPVWMVALAAFLLGSVLCGAAWSTGSLIGFRVLQGIGGGLLVPIMQTILAQAAGPKGLTRLIGVIAIPVTLAPVLGPVLGGVILDDFSWRWIFYINVPICLAALVLAWRGLPETTPRPGHRLDVIGLLLLSPGLATIIYACSRAGSHGGFGDTSVLVLLAAGCALLAGFAVHALRLRADAILDLRLFRSRAFGASSALMFLFGGSLFGAMFLLPLYYQQAGGHSALQAGLLLAPQGLGMMVALVGVGRVTDRFGARNTVLGGIVLSALGTVAYATVGTDTSEWLLGVSLFVRGIGLGAAFTPVISSAYHGLEREDIPQATTAVRIFQQIGGSLGTAVLAVILQQQLGGDAGNVSGAFAHAFAWTLGLTVVAIIPALLLPGRELPERLESGALGHAPVAGGAPAQAAD